MTSLLPLQIAEITYAANRIYCRHARSKSKQRWNRLGSEVHKAVEEGVLYAIAHPHCSPEEIHEAWCDTMRRSGYQPGGVVDHGAKVHANLVPWDTLPEREQAKDVLFLAIVRALTQQSQPASEDYAPSAEEAATPQVEGEDSRDEIDFGADD